MLGKQLLEQCGTVEVRVAPLLAMIGAVMTLDGASDFENMLELLEPTKAM
jgi:hypothetical protein